MKKAMYEIEKEYWGNNVKVYNPNRFQRFLSSIETVDFFELRGLAFLSSIVSLILCIGGVFSSYLTNDNIIAVVFSLIFFALFILSIFMIVFSFILDVLFESSWFSSLFEKTPLYSFSDPRKYREYSIQTLENILNHEDFQEDFLHLLEIYNDIEKEEFSDILEGMVNHYDTINKDLFAEEVLETKKIQAKEDANNLKFKYDTLNEVMPKDYIR